MTSLLLTIPLTIITVLSILLNALIIVIVVLSRQVAVANNILLLHLGAINALLGVLFIVFAVPAWVRGTTWPLPSAGGASGALCGVHGFLFQLLHPLLLWTLCGLNCDRYYAIAAPLHYTHIVNGKKVLIGLGFGWVVSILLCIPPLFAIAPYRVIPGFGVCAADFTIGLGALWYGAIYTAITLLLPATLIICCNVKILMIARHHRHRIASAIYEVTLSAQVTITHQRNPFFVPTVTAPSAGGPKFRARSPIASLLQILGTFLLVYLPFYISILWDASVATLLPSTVNPSSSTSTSATDQTTAPLQLLQSYPHIQTATFALLTCSPMINGFLYGARAKVIRNTLKNYWRKQVTKNEVNQEIQARTPSTCGSRRQSLTPLGFFATKNSNSIPRRLSETLLDIKGAVSPSSSTSRMKRIASELAWRPGSASALDMVPISAPHDVRPKIVQTTSCNTLRVPTLSDEDGSDDIMAAKLQPHRFIDSILTLPTRPSLSSTNLFLQRLFGNDDNHQNNPKSPTILITRAMSQDSSNTGSKRHVVADADVDNHTPLLHRQQEDGETLMMNGGNEAASSSVTTGDCSDNSDSSSGSRIYMQLDHRLLRESDSTSMLLMGGSPGATPNGADLELGGDESEESELLTRTSFSMTSIDRQRMLRAKRREMRSNFFRSTGNGIGSAGCGEIQEVVL